MVIRKSLMVITYVLFFSLTAFSQKIELLESKAGISLRGLSVVSDKIIWVCGNNGMVGKSVDGGKTWQWMQVADHQTRDFRDIEAFDSHTAIVMASGEPALLLKTTNDGIYWKTVYKNETPGMFLDAMEFWNAQSGIVVGDPVKGRFFIARTFDEGNNWRALAYDKLPVADSGEACFAASGTIVRALARDEACFVSGGCRSRLFWKGKPVDLPIIQGKETQGANSIAVWFKKVKTPHITVVGGDFQAGDSRKLNCAVSKDGGESWITPSNPPYGYRSCVEYITAEKLITCGINGVDISLDEGINWNSISSLGFHVCRKAKNGNAVFLAGGEGKIGRLVE